MKTHHGIIGIIAIVLVVIVGGVFLVSKKSGGLKENTDEVRPRQMPLGTLERQKVETNDTLAQLASATLTETYRNTMYDFSLKYPKGFLTNSFRQGDADFVTISDNATGLGVQISITSFDEPTTNITAERVKQDIPDIVINDPQDVLLGSLGRGIAFVDGSGSEAKRQVWFVARGHLFQLTTPIAFDATLKKMLTTWAF